MDIQVLISIVVFGLMALVYAWPRRSEEPEEARQPVTYGDFIRVLHE
ncbi:MAG TPA: hypothetical protein VFB12_29435 [Ktedonobacteraceae bacterium]|nr:hypothetical protein [Ktedonobacteraceae bacterium]